MEVDDRGDMNIDIIFGHTHLGRDFDDRDFNVDLLQVLAQSARLEEILKDVYGLTLVKPGSTARWYFPNFKTRPV